MPVDFGDLQRENPLGANALVPTFATEQAAIEWIKDRFALRTNATPEQIINFARNQGIIVHIEAPTP